MVNGTVEALHPGTVSVVWTVVPVNQDQGTHRAETETEAAAAAAETEAEAADLKWP